MKLYVQIYTETGFLGMDCPLTPEEADNLNMRLAANGEPYRWERYGDREGDAAA